MTVARRIEVDEFDPLSAARVIGRVPRTPSTLDRARLVGVGGTLVLHGFAASLFIASTFTHKTSPPDSGAGTALQAHATLGDELIFVNTTGLKGSDSARVAVNADLRSQLARLAIPALIPDQTLEMDLHGSNADAEISSQSDGSPGDTDLRARMMGRYSGQISARIERAWEKPRSSVNDSMSSQSRDVVDPDTFVCRVQIRQDQRGNVQEVLMLACNGTEAWRHSLVVAINQSSPLPAPPTPTVFRRALTMTFEGHADGERTAPRVGEPPAEIKSR